MSSYSYGWENKNCEMLLPFVCEVLAGIEAPTTLEPPTQPPLIPCQVDTVHLKKNFSNRIFAVHPNVGTMGAMGTMWGPHAL